MAMEALMSFDAVSMAGSLVKGMLLMTAGAFAGWLVLTMLLTAFGMPWHLANMVSGMVMTCLGLVAVSHVLQGGADGYLAGLVGTMLEQISAPFEAITSVLNAPM